MTAVSNVAGIYRPEICVQQLEIHCPYTGLSVCRPSFERPPFLIQIKRVVLYCSVERILFLVYDVTRTNRKLQEPRKAGAVNTVPSTPLMGNSQCNSIALQRNLYITHNQIIVARVCCLSSLSRQCVCYMTINTSTISLSL